LLKQFGGLSGWSESLQSAAHGTWPSQMHGKCKNRLRRSGKLGCGMSLVKRM